MLMQRNNFYFSKPSKNKKNRVATHATRLCDKEKNDKKYNN